MFHEIPEPTGQKERKEKKRKRIKRAILRDFQKTSPRDPFTLDAYRGYSAIISFIKQTVRLISFNSNRRTKGNSKQGEIEPVDLQTTD